MKTAYLWHTINPALAWPWWSSSNASGMAPAPTLNTHSRSPSFNTWPSVPVVAARKCSWFHPHSTCWGKIWEIELVEELVHAVQQSNNRKPTFLPNCCSTTMISIRPCSTKTVFWWSMHSLYLLGNEMAWKDGLVDVTKKSQKPQHNNLPCFPPLLHSNPISCTAFLLQKVRGIREWQLGQGTNWIAYQKPVTIVGHVAMSSGFVLGPMGPSEEQAQGSKSL